MKLFTVLVAAPLALCATIGKRESPPPYAHPVAYSTLNVNTGAVSYNNNHPQIKRGPSTEISHVATIRFNESLAGRTCYIGLSVGYFVGDRHRNKISGSKQVDIFRVVGHPTKSTSGFPREFYRDTPIGRVTIADNWRLDSFRTFLPDANAYFPCPAGKTLTYEVVPAGESVDIDLRAAGAGLVVGYNAK